MIAGPAILTPGPIVVKIPPPIIVPRPTAMRSRAPKARLSVLRRLSFRSRSSDVVAKSRPMKVDDREAILGATSFRVK
jgi:hypothetical protein